MTATSFSYSMVEYRTSLGEEGNPIPIGIVVEGLRRGVWTVGMQARVALSPEEMEQLDGIGRALMVQPAEFLKNEVEAVLLVARHPGEVLQILSEKHAWSFHVQAPRELVVRPSTQSFKIALASRIKALLERRIGSAELADGNEPLFARFGLQKLANERATLGRRIGELAFWNVQP